nr:hypothetical protein [Candidatus Cloacimonadota bacterium]
MTAKIPKLSLSLLVGLFMFLPLMAQSSRQQSTFHSEIHSRVLHSLLNSPDYLYEHKFLNKDDGLHHPFESYTKVARALEEAFLPGEPQNNLLSYQHDLFTADFNFLAGYETSLNDPGNYGYPYKGWRINARYSDYLHLNTYWYNGAFYGDLDAAEEDPLIDGYYKRFDNHIQLDNLSGEFGFYKDQYNLALGRGRFQIGNSISGSIILNDEVNDYAYLKAEASIGIFRFSFLHGSLMADSTYAIHDNAYVDSNYYPEKYIALHQISFNPWKDTEIFAGETVIYGNRGIDLNYLLPNSFWRAVEHDLWDRDNMMIYGGINQRLRGDALVYAQMVLDEFSYSKFFTSWWGNKYALQSGISLPLGKSTLGFEATAVRPYTYAHFTNHTMYSHNRKSLGYPQGSNVLDLSFEANIPIAPFLHLDSQISWRKRGSKGNSWQDNYHDIFGGQIDEASAYWFEGEKSHEYQIRSSLLFSLMAHHDILLAHDSLKTDSWSHRIIAAWQFKY